MITSTLRVFYLVAALALASSAGIARAQAQERVLVFGTTESVPFGTVFELLGIIPGINSTVTVSSTPGSAGGASANLTGDGRLTCSAQNGQVHFTAGHGPSASATCYARACTTTLGLITLCNTASFPLRSVECRAGAGRVDAGCTADTPACDTSGATPTCVGCTEDLHCGAQSPIVAAVGQVVRVADDLLRQLLGVSATAVLTDVTVSANANGPFTDEALLGADLACRATSDDRVEVAAGANASGEATCYVRACVAGLLCTVAPLDVLVDLCLAGGECNPVATCDLATHECVACRDDRGPGQIDSGCTSATPSCQTLAGVATCTECDGDDDCAASLLSTLLGPEQEVTVALAEVLEFLRLDSTLLPSALSVSSTVDGPFTNEALLGADLQVASCAVTASGDLRVSSNGVEANATCYVRLCASLFGDAVSTCVTAPLDVTVDACVLRNDCDKEPVCLADSTCATCADTAEAGHVDRGCDGDTPACAGGTCVECLADLDCNPRHPLLHLDLGETGVVSRDLLLASADLAALALVDTLEVGATVIGPFGSDALVDVGAEVATCHIDLDGDLQVLAPATVYGQATCHVRACAELLTTTTCVVIPVEINVDPCASRGDCRPPICGTDNVCRACSDDGAGQIDRGCGEGAPACLETVGDGICVECTEDADCGGDVCDLSSHRCVPCLDSGDGVDRGCDEEAPVCHAEPGATPECEPCLDDTTGAIDTGCDEELPACELGGGTCEECTVDADCDGDLVCTPDHRCVPCSDTATGVAPDLGCGPEAPICTSGEPERCEPCIDDTEGEVDTGCEPTLPACIEGTEPNRCGECTVDADCPGRLLCNSQNECVTCADGRGNCSPGNRPPLALDDHVTTPEDVAVLVVVGANDSDPEGHAFAPRTIAVPPRNGAAILLTDGTVLYTPQPDFHGVDILRYETCDDRGACSDATVRIEVLPVNDRPEAFDDYAQTPVDTSVTVDVLANDVDRDGDVLFVQSLMITRGTGLASFTIDGRIVYVPGPSDEGQDVMLRYTACDPAGACESATLTIAVGDDEPVPMPVLVDDLATTTAGVDVQIDVLANDTAPIGTTLAIASWSGAAGGAILLEDGLLRYAPRLGFLGEDRFRYVACTGDGRCASASVTVMVQADGDLPPIATSDEVTTLVDTPVTFDPTANDLDPEGGDLTVISTSAPEHGTSSLDGMVTYAPAPGFVGTDRFTVTIADPAGNTAESAVLVRVIDSENEAPEALDDALTIEAGENGLVDVLANDRDPDGDPLHIVSVEQPRSGRVTFDGAELPTEAPTAPTLGFLVVRMNDGFIGTETFTYRITDGRGGFASAVVTVTVLPTNAAPAVEDDTVELAEDTSVTVDVLANDSDADGEALTLTSIALLPAHGQVELVAGGVRYTPSPDFHGADAFRYEACDSRGACGVGRVAVTVTPVSDPPVARDDRVEVQAGRETLIAVLANDTDVDGDTLTLSALVEMPDLGSARIEGAHIAYAAPASPATGVTVRYEVCDPTDLCAEAEVIIDVVAGEPGGPIAADDEATTAEGTSVVIDVLANDTHTAGATLSIGAFGQPAIGGEVARAPGGLVYRPASGFTGELVFIYSACDAAQRCDEAEVHVRVTPRPGNRAPNANDDAFLVYPGSITTLDALGNDSDPDGDTFTVTAVTPVRDAALGRVELDDGVIRFIANSEAGDTSFDYTVCDPNDCSTATATVSVAAQPERFRVKGGPGCGGAAGGLLLGLLGLCLVLARRR